MKKIFTLSIFMFFITTSFAQTIKIYLDNDGKKCDSTQAASIIYFYNKTDADTVFRMEQYTVNKQLLTSGGYLDRAHTILHGPFKYYGVIFPTRSQLGKDSTEVRQKFFIQEEGSYYKDKKNGVWTTYFNDGSKRGFNTYKDDVLNGLSITYSNDSNGIFYEGYYINGKKDGVWKMNNGTTISIYRDGKYIPSQEDKDRDAQLKAKLKEESKYNVEARPVGDFNRDLQRFMATFDFAEVKRETAKIILRIDENGKLFLESINGLTDAAVAQRFAEFFATVRWVPATMGKEKRPVQSRFTYTLYF